MRTITINTRKSEALSEWMMKEAGSWEDHNGSHDHVCAILNRFGGKLTLTEIEAKTVLKSGDYQQHWNDDEIVGGAKTKATIARYCDKIRKALNS